MRTFILGVASVCMLIDLLAIARQLHEINYQMTLMNCLTMAKVGQTCSAAQRDPAQ